MRISDWSSDVCSSDLSYVDDSLQLAALVVCDLPMSAHAGAAIGLVPPDQALAAIADGALTDALAENLYAVLNIAAAMFNVDGAPHVRLPALAPAGGPIDPQLMARALTLDRREDAALTISGYGAGQLPIVLVCPLRPSPPGLTPLAHP